MNNYELAIHDCYRVMRDAYSAAMASVLRGELRQAQELFALAADATAAANEFRKKVRIPGSVSGH